MPARSIRYLLSIIVAIGLSVAAVTAPSGGAIRAQDSTDPFVSILGSLQGEGALVPPRAFAVIPERHTGRLVRVVDQLTAIDPQFDDLARGLGLTGQRAIQFRTREAHIPFFVEKTQATIATMLQIPMGSNIEVRGVLVERGGRYLFLARDLRAAQAAAAARRPATAPAAAPRR